MFLAIFLHRSYGEGCVLYIPLDTVLRVMGQLLKKAHMIVCCAKKAWYHDAVTAYGLCCYAWVCRLGT